MDSYTLAPGVLFAEIFAPGTESSFGSGPSANAATRGRRFFSILGSEPLPDAGLLDVPTKSLAATPPRPTHDMGDGAIGERSALYRFAKKHWFFGFGAYG